MCYILRAAEKNYLNSSFPSLDEVSLSVQGLRYATSMISDDASSIYSIVGPMPKKPPLKISIPVRTSSKNNSPGSSNISQKALHNLPGANPPWNEEKEASTGSKKASKMLDNESGGALQDSSIHNDEDWDTCSGFSDSPTITSISDDDDTYTTTVSLEPFWQYSLVSAAAATTTTDDRRPVFFQETEPLGRWKKYKRKAKRVASMLTSSVKKIAALHKDASAGMLAEEAVAEARCYSAYPPVPPKEEEENPSALFSAVLYSEVVPRRCRSASAPDLAVCRDRDRDGFWIKKAKVLRNREGNREGGKGKYETW